MPALSTPTGEQATAQRPILNAAQQALRGQRVLTLKSLLHGDYYQGLLDDATAVARWHAHRRRFVFWEQHVGQQNLKAAPHVADLGTGPRFAPLAQLDAPGDAHLSDFAFETAR